MTSLVTKLHCRALLNILRTSTLCVIEAAAASWAFPMVICTVFCIHRHSELCDRCKLPEGFPKVSNQKHDSRAGHGKIAAGLAMQSSPLSESRLPRPTIEQNQTESLYMSCGARCDPRRVNEAHLYQPQPANDEGVLSSL